MSEVNTEKHEDGQEASSTSTAPRQHRESTGEAATGGSPREYEQTGLYPPEGKSFRIWALLGWLAGVIVVLAGISALLNFLLLG